MVIYFRFFCFLLLAVAAQAELVRIQPLEELKEIQQATLSGTSKDEEVQRLQAKLPERLLFQRAPLREVLISLASKAEMQYLAPGSEPIFDEPITMDTTQNPYEAITMLGARYGFVAIYTQSVWQFRTVDDNQLIVRVYKLRNNLSDAGMNDAETASTGLGQSNFRGANRGGGVGGGGGSVRREQLSTPSQTAEKVLKLISGNASNVLVAKGGFVDSLPDLGAYPPGLTPLGAAKEAKAGTVIEDKDTNSLTVVATLAQHALVEAFLKTIDVPLPQVLITVRFVDTSYNPSLELGIDWTKTTKGATLKLSDLTSPTLDFNQPGKTFRYPQAAVLSASELSLVFNALASETKSRLNKFQRTQTPHNRAAKFEAVVNQPVLSASSTTQSSIVTNQQTVEYLPIGTTSTFLPIVKPNGKILLNTIITISDILGSITLGGNPYPITTNRTFVGQQEIMSGQTIMVTGLDEAFDSAAFTKVPWFSSIPILGEFFKNQARDKRKRHLLMFVTATIVGDERASEQLRNIRSEGLYTGPIPTKAEIEKADLSQVEDYLEACIAEVDFLKDVVTNSVADDNIIARMKKVRLALMAICTHLGKLGAGDESSDAYKVFQRGKRAYEAAVAVERMFQKQKIGGGIEKLF